MPAPDLPPPPSFDVPRQRPFAVHLHTRFVAPERFAGGVVIVIDALRASVTIAQALHAGARAIVPCLSVDECRETAQRLRGQGVPRVLLGGERGGVRIEGFDLDNSPRSYTQDAVAGATICFTTSNGTAGLRHAGATAARVLVGSMCNASAIVASVAHDPRPVHVLCCGTRDDVSMDDCLPAGAMTRGMLAAGRESVTDDSARMCLALFDGAQREHAAAGPAGVERLMRESRGGRNLVRIGLEDDVALCARLDTLPVVPEFDARAGRITLASP